MNDVFRTKEFWTAVVGAVATLALYFTAKYFAAGLEDLQVILNVMLPIVLAMIGAYTVQNVARVYQATQIEIEHLRFQALQTQLRLAAMEPQQK